MSDLRNELIKTAAALPSGSAERQAVLQLVTAGAIKFPEHFNSTRELLRFLKSNLPSGGKLKAKVTKSFSPMRILMVEGSGTVGDEYDALRQAWKHAEQQQGPVTVNHRGETMTIYL